MNRPAPRAIPRRLDWLGASALAIAVAGSASAQDTTEIRTTLINIMGANNCLMEEKQVVAQLKAQGVSVKQALPVIKTMIGEKVVRRGKGKFQLSKSVCPAKPVAQQQVQVDTTVTVTTAPQQQPAAPALPNYGPDDKALVDFALDNGCRLTRAHAREAAALIGKDPAEVEVLLTRWVTGDWARYDSRTVILNDALCPPVDVAATGSLGWADVPQTYAVQQPPGDTYAANSQQVTTQTDAQGAPSYTPAPPFLFPAQDPATRSEPMTKLLLLIRQNGCVMNEVEADDILPTYGLTRDQVLPIIDQFEADGVMTFDDQGNAYLGTLLCGAHGLDPFDFGTRADALLEYVEESGCALEDGDPLEAKLRDVGFFMEDMPTLVDILVGDGLAYLETVPETGLEAIVASTDYCAG